jgi:hypothetical protein
MITAELEADRFDDSSLRAEAPTFTTASSSTQPRGLAQLALVFHQVVDQSCHPACHGMQIPALIG